MTTRFAAGATVAILVSLVLVVRSAYGAEYCFGDDTVVGGGYSIGSVFNSGIRSSEDVEPGPVSSGQAIAHAIHLLSITDDWIGFGTMRGRGSRNPNAITNCPDDYSSGWRLYIDGVKFEEYFCRHLGSTSGTLTNTEFKLKYVDDCNGTARWKASYNGGFLTCQNINDDSAFHIAAQAEATGSTSPLHIDVHFDDLDWYSPTNDFWYSWGSGGTTCDDIGYVVRKLANDDVWIEER